MCVGRLVITIIKGDAANPSERQTNIIEFETTLKSFKRPCLVNILKVLFMLSRPNDNVILALNGS